MLRDAKVDRRPQGFGVSHKLISLMVILHCMNAKYLGLGIALGTSLGVSFGAAFGEVAIGSAFGTTFGLLIGVVMSLLVKAGKAKNDPEEQN